jgi:hypothetical protein
MVLPQRTEVLVVDWLEPVRLEYATAQNFSSGAASDRYTYVRVKVRNLAYAKDTRLHYREGDSWRDYGLPWAGHYGNYDVFAGRAPHCNEFVVSCTMNGRTYWDNNDGRNYDVHDYSSAIGGSLVLRSARQLAFASYERSVRGAIYLENRHYEKQVGVRLLPMGATDWIDVGAHYVGIPDEATVVALGPIEQWEFSSAIYRTYGFTLAAYYRDLATGETFWDNNFGQNYRLVQGQLE